MAALPAFVDDAASIITNPKGFAGLTEFVGHPASPCDEKRPCRRNMAVGRRLFYHSPSGCSGLVNIWDRIVQASERERQEKMAALGAALRNSVRVPTDTYITGDIPTLMTRLGQVPAVPRPKSR